MTHHQCGSCRGGHPCHSWHGGSCKSVDYPYPRWYDERHVPCSGRSWDSPHHYCDNFRAFPPSTLPELYDMPPPPPAEAPREDEKDRVVDKLVAVVKSLEAKIDYLENKLEQKEEMK